MKVQIEISEQALSIAILSMVAMVKSGADRYVLEKAVERCKNEITEIDIEKHDEDGILQVALALFAITRQGELMQEGGEK